MKRRNVYMIILLSFLVTGCTSIVGKNPQSMKPNTWYNISEFIDADTFRIQVGDGEQTIQLLSIEAPSASEDADPFGLEAAAYSRQLLSESEQIRLSFDKQMTDDQERYLAIVELRDGRILNEELLEMGYAKVQIEEPNVKMENLYKKLEQQAKQDKLAIWSTGTESSHADVPLRVTTQTGITLVVDKEKELATITNHTLQPVDLEGWKLVSILGNQTYTFQSYTLDAQADIIVSSGNPKNPSNKLNVKLWEVDDVWNTTQSDPGELYNDHNELVARWEDN